MQTGVAIDLGTSGFRAVSIDLSSGEAIASAATLCHPLPGRNIVDHLLFVSAFGSGTTRRVISRCINRLLASLGGSPEIIAVCGNTAETSLFTGTEYRDMLFDAASLSRKCISVPDRAASVVSAGQLGLDAGCDVMVPPAIKAEVGADAIAMILETGMLSAGNSIATDFGTNAEMALKAGNRLLVGSAAAGPAIEGQHVRGGMLAAPGAIADLEYDWGWKLRVLDERMELRDGDTVDLALGRVLRKGRERASGITGTGVIAVVSTGLSAGLIDPPRITTPDHLIHLQDGLDFSEADLAEAGKAFGAILAGHSALAARAGLHVDDIPACYMAGAAGAYVDPLKARDVGLVPPGVTRVIQHGNTSLQLAGDLATGAVRLDTMEWIADMAEHVSFTTDPAFKDHFLRALAWWCEGARYPVRVPPATPAITRLPEKRKPRGTAMIKPAYVVEAGGNAELAVRCCPGRALRQIDSLLEVDLLRCNGASCLRCEQKYKVGFGRPVQ